MVRVDWSRRALKHLMKIDKRYQKIIYQKVGELVSFPVVTLDIKKMQGSDNHYRPRVPFIFRHRQDHKLGFACFIIDVLF